MAKTYFATRLTENISRTPEGYLICRDAVLARTGFQTYKISELPQERAAELGVDIGNPDASIDLYRRPEDVFAPSTLASFEGKPVTDSHPYEFVDPTNFKQHACGHVQNVRKGPEPLESGDLPLIGDVIITDAALIQKVENGLRELSCGYDFALDKDGEKILQVAILGNHVAVVPKGRAGAEARINDSKPDLAADAEMRLVEAAAWDRDTAKASDGNSKKEKAKVKATDRLRELLGLGLKAKAADATPEEMADYLVTGARALDEEPEKKEEKGEDRRMDDRRADDKRSDDRKMDDRRADDAACKPGEDGHKDCTADKCMAKDRKARDAKADDKKAKAHALLDKMFEKEEANSEDADMKELAGMFSKYLGEEAGEAQHAGDEEEEEKKEEKADDKKTDDEGSEILEPVEEGEDENVMAHDEDSVPANDSAAALMPIIDRIRVSDSKSPVVKAFDAALATALDDEHQFVKLIKPAIAKCKDAKAKSVLNAQIHRLNGVSKARQGGGYDDFAGAAGRVGDAANDQADNDPLIKKLQTAYEAAASLKEVK